MVHFVDVRQLEVENTVLKITRSKTTGVRN